MLTPWANTLHETKLPRPAWFIKAVYISSVTLRIVNTKTLFYLTTRITASLRQFRVTADSAALVAIPIFRGSGSKRFNWMHCG
jgi:hypothetical protein